MTHTQTCSQISPAIDELPARLSARTAGLARRAWRAYWNRRAQQATVLMLGSLDDRTLRDIGINPSEISSCVYGKGGDRRRSYDAMWPWRPRR